MMRTNAARKIASLTSLRQDQHRGQAEAAECQQCGLSGPTLPHACILLKVTQLTTAPFIPPSGLPISPP